MSKIGILGGSFNPIHLGHLAAAKAAYQALCFDYIFFIPSYLPPQKNIKLLAYERRLFLVEQAIKDEKHFLLVPFAGNWQKPNYTADLMALLYHDFPHDDFTFIIGYDNAFTLKTWHNWQWLLANVNFLVVSRLAHDERVEFDYFKKLQFVQMENINISSSEIREKLNAQEDIAHLVPAVIRPYLLDWRQDFCSTDS